MKFSQKCHYGDFFGNTFQKLVLFQIFFQKFFQKELFLRTYTEIYPGVSTAISLEIHRLIPPQNTQELCRELLKISQKILLEIQPSMTFPKKFRLTFFHFMKIFFSFFMNFIQNCCRNLSGIPSAFLPLKNSFRKFHKKKLDLKFVQKFHRIFFTYQKFLYGYFINI